MKKDRNILEQALDKVAEKDETEYQLTEQANKNRDIIANIRRRMLSGELTYDQAEAEAKPTMDAMNDRIREIAREYKVKPKLLSFKYIIR